MTLDLLTLARRIIAIDSSSARSNLDIVEFLVPLCQRAGLQTEVQEETRDGVRQFNLLASRRPVDPDTLLLATHTDTVPPGDPSLWTACDGDPFALTEHDGLLYGLGTADVKLALLCGLLALHSLRDTELRDNVALAATYGEETGRYGAKLLTARLAASSGGVPRRVLVGEPTRLQPGTSHKGYLEFRTEGSDPAPAPVPAGPCWRLVFQGVSSHSSQPHLGASANAACLDALAKMSGGAATPAGGGATAAGGGAAVTPGIGAAATPGDAAVGALAILSVQGGDVVNKVAARCEALVAAAQAPRPDLALDPDAAVAGIIYTVEPAEAPPGSTWSPELARLLLTVHALTGRLERGLRALETEGFDPPFSTVNNGVVNLTNARLAYVVDVRRLPGEAPAKLVDAHETALRSLEGVSPPHWETVRLRSERVLDSAPFHAQADSQVLAALMMELGIRGLSLDPELKSGTTEAPVYQDAGMDTVIFGPGQAAGNIHRPNEHVPVAELQGCVEIYRDLILRLCAR